MEHRHFARCRFTLNTLGIITSEVDSEAARDLYAEASRIAHGIGDERVAALFGCNLVGANLALLKPNEAADGARRAIQTMRRLGDELLEANALGLLAAAQVAAGEPAAARTTTSEELERLGEFRPQGLVVEALTVLAMASAMDDPSEAVVLWSVAERARTDESFPIPPAVDNASDIGYKRLSVPKETSIALRPLVTLLVSAGIVAGVAGASTDASRVLRLNVSDTAIQYLDPALSYDFIGWRLEFATCARLLRNPDKPGAASARLVPEVAVAIPRPTAGGTVYRFQIRSGFRFSDGRPVTAGSFARAVERALDPGMQSPAASFLGDVVGVAAVQAGKAKRPSGVTVSGNTITFRLTEPRADFLARIGMPFFCAVPTDLPIDAKGVNTPPGAGPYYVAVFDPDRSVILRRNPHYGGDRPQRWDEIRVTLNVDTNQSYLEVRSGASDLDLAGLPPASHGALTKQYGINKGRYYVTPIQTIQYIALNTTRPFFKDVAARQAVAFAIDRSALMRAAGLNGGIPNDQLLAPGLPGYQNVTIFPNSPNVARAKQLLAGRKGTVVMLSGNDPISVNQAQIIKANLAAIGITVNVRTFPFAVQIAKAGRRGEPFDMNLIGWFADYPDPYDFINILLYGKTIAQANNINTAYFDDPAFNKRMEEASRLVGAAREKAYARLDADITRAAPFAVYGNSTAREFVSSRLGCKMAAPTASGLNLVMLCEKTT